LAKLKGLEEQLEKLQKHLKTYQTEVEPLTEKVKALLPELKKEDVMALKEDQKPGEVAVLAMEVVCSVFLQQEPEESQRNKVEGDKTGYFLTAQESFLKDPEEFTKKLQE
jgi:hypothetical protein